MSIPAGYLKTDLITALGRDSSNAFDTFVNALKADGVDNKLDMAIAMRLTHLANMSGKDVDVTFHSPDNIHLLCLAKADVVDGVTVLTKKSGGSRVSFPVSLDIL